MSAAPASGVSVNGSRSRNASTSASNPRKCLSARATLTDHEVSGRIHTDPQWINTQRSSHPDECPNYPVSTVTA